jgi:hypothetical protein
MEHANQRFMIVTQRYWYIHMEKVTMRETKRAEYKHFSGPDGTSGSQFGDEMVLHLSLEGILPPGHILAVHPHLGILAHLSCDFKEPRLLNVQRFSATEMCLLLPLLQQYPAYCPYEVLLAHFTSARVTEETIARAREQMYEAQEAGLWDSLMRPIRNVLSRARFRLGDLGIGVVSMLEIGYMLKPALKQ